ncbi:hypothetical protein BT96DRAFT_1032399 [Gymnopus androsaceus JB14]|uniref:Uncharacterized protein n=1 Tax=Gymnopus androsaceus JB14 TaxID=1447944 RepID=A0A6A4HKW4_9AGAR|nr:hypothetical protein BT96DRAFT_1032399 [Gymnopus androsaceus JB14]
MYPHAIGYTHITSGTNPWTPLRFNLRFLEDPIDIAILQWCYKRGHELAHQIRSFRGEIPAGNPKFPPTTTTNAASAASVVPSTPGPVNIDTPDIAYSVEDDKAIDNHHRVNLLGMFHSVNNFEAFGNC